MPSGSSLDLRKTAQKAGGDSLDSLLNQLRAEEDLTSRAMENIEKYLKSLLQANETWKEFTTRIKDSDKDWRVINEHVQKLVDDFDLLTNTSEEIVGIFGEIRKGLGGVNGELSDAKKAVNGIYSISQKVVDSVNIEGLYTRRNLKTNMQKAAQAMQTYQREVNYIESIYGKGQAGQQALLDEMDSLQAKIRRQQNELGELRGSERAAAYARIASWKKQADKAEWYFQIVHEGHQEAAKSAERAAKIVYESYDEAIKGTRSGFARMFTGIAKNFGIDTSGAQEYLDSTYQQRGKAISDYRMFKESLVGSETVKGTFEGKGISYDKNTGKFSSTEERQEASSSYAAILEAKSKKEQEESNLENLIQKALRLKANGLQTLSTGKSIDDKIAEYRSELQGLTADIEDLGKKADELDEKFALSTADQLITELEAKEKEQNKTLKETNVTFSGFFRSLLRIPEGVRGVKALGAAFSAAGGWIALLVGLVNKLWNSLKGMNESSVRFKRLTGEWVNAGEMTTSKFADSKKVLEQAADLTEEIGINARHIFTDEELGRATELQNMLGYSSKEAGNLALQAKIAGQNESQFAKAVEEGHKRQVLQTKAAVPLGPVLKEAANASYKMQATLGFNAQKIAAAATSAKALGMSLEELDSISRNLLDFESSISNQMEAQLMTGRALNLNRAREAALMGDLETVGNTLASQGVTLEEFGRMNVLAKDSLAKALGMDIQQMSKMLILQKLHNGESSEAVAIAANMTVEQVEAMKMTDRWEEAMNKLVRSLTPLLEIIPPVIDGITKIISLVAWPIGAITQFVGRFERWVGTGFGKLQSDADKATASAKKGLDNVASSTKEVGKTVEASTVQASSFLVVSLALGKAWKGILTYAKGLALLGLDKVGGLLKNTSIGKTAGKVKEHFTSVTDRATQTGAAASKGAEGINSTTQAAARTGMNAGKILAGAAAMLAFAGAIWILVKAMQGLKEVGWEQFGMFAAAAGVMVGAIGILTLIGTFAGPGLALAAAALLSFGTSVALAGAGIAAAALSIGIAGKLIGDSITGCVNAYYEGKAKLEKAKASVVDSQASLVEKLASISPEQLTGVGLALVTVGAGLERLSSISLGSIMDFFGAGPISKLLELAAAGDGMQAFATAVVTLATAVVTLNAALDHLNTEKLAGLSKIKGLNLQVGNLANVAVVNSGLPVASAPEKTIETVIQKEDKVAQEKTGESNRNSKEILNLQEGLKTINQKFDKLISLVQTPRATTVTLDQRVFDGQVIYGSSL